MFMHTYMRMCQNLWLFILLFKLYLELAIPLYDPSQLLCVHVCMYILLYIYIGNMYFQFATISINNMHGWMI